MVLEFFQPTTGSLECFKAATTDLSCPLWVAGDWFRAATGIRQGSIDAFMTRKEFEACSSRRGLKRGARISFPLVASRVLAVKGAGGD